MRRARRPQSRAARLTKEWYSFFTIDSVTNEFDTISLLPGRTFAAWILDPLLALGDFDEPTLLRTRIAMTAAFENPGQNDSEGLWAGIRLASADAASLGTFVTSSYAPVGNPYDGGYMDWVWHSTWALTAPNAAAGAPAVGSYLQQNQWDDVKTKRRIESGNGLIFMATTPPSNQGQVNFTMVGRQLVGH